MPNMESLKTDGHYTLARKIFSKIKNWVENKVQTDVPANAVFSDYHSNIDLYVNSRYYNYTLSTLQFDSTDFKGFFSSVGREINGKVSLKHHVGVDVPANAVFTDTTYSDATTSASGLMSAEDKTLVSTGISDAYDNTSTYDVGDIVIYNGSLYICNTAITTAEDFDSSKWDATNLGDLIESIHSEIHPLVDKIYPVGSYFETTDTNFDPNVSWGGTWVLEDAGLVHVSAGHGYAVSSNSKDGGDVTKSYTPAGTVGGHAITVAEMPSHNHRVGWVTVNNGSNKSATYDGQPFLRSGLLEQNTYQAYSNSKGSGSAHSHGFTGTNASINVMQPYKVVNRWHRTA